MAIDAGYGLVATGEREAGALVLQQRVIGCLEGEAIVAPLAAIVPWGCRKLPVVFIPVAVHAESELDPVSSVLAGRGVAVCALSFSVRRSQGKAGLGMIGCRVSGGPPALHGVATLAPAAVRAFQELPAVRIGIVAIGAIGKGHGGLEVGALVAAQARHIEVFSQQWVAGLRVIEGGNERGFLPCRSIVAGIATLRELAFMRIGVA